MLQLTSVDVTLKDDAVKICFIFCLPHFETLTD